jgi:hypothetical protein
VRYDTTAGGHVTDNESKRGVAVIAVHGVADQKAGETAHAVAELLIAAPPAPARYRLTGAEDIGLRVEPLRPSPATEAAADNASSPPPNPRGERPLAKAAAQSLRSDMHRPDWVVDPAHPMVEGAPADAPAGIALTEFLLFKALRNGTPAAVYDTRRLALEREGDAAAARVDIYEMYWADLSRLASGVPRILTELFTLLFRMSQLGRDTVAAAARQFAAEESHPRRWRAFSAAQAALDWWFSKGLALLTLQLLMMALVIVPVGLVSSMPGFADAARGVLVILVPAVTALWWLYRFGRRRIGLLLAGAALVVAAYGALAALPSHWVVGLAWLALLSVGYDAVMRVCDARFPMTRFIGWLMWPAVVAVLLAAAAGLPSALPGLDGERGLRIFSFGALRGVEWILAANVLWWGVAALALLAWLVLGQACAGERGFESRASVATGRLGLFASLGFFVVLVMASWALLTTPLTLSVAGMQYQPLIFRDSAQPVVSAAAFLDARYVNSTETFSLAVLLLLGLGLHVVVGTLPSALAEMKFVTEHPARLGRWLTGALRWLDMTVMGVAVMAVVVATVVGIGLNSRWFGTTWLATLNEAFPQVPRWSREFLMPLVWTAASATLALSVLGGVLSRYVPWLRAPLDMALDVDSHFREFPRRGIPRSRIFSRFAALLEHVASQGYERIVIVSHSQGTVISTELLRYLRYRADHASEGAGDDAAAALWRSLAPRLHLLTAGCPLRQLYAARFPTLYRWVLARHGDRMGPRATEAGVQRWVNAYTTGDYVGRWLWSRGPRPGGEVSDTMIDARERDGDVYDSAAQPPDLAALMGDSRECDVCLGTGAHTHYFETDQRCMAGLIDQLVAAPWPGAAQHDAQAAAPRRAA